MSVASLISLFGNQARLAEAAGAAAQSTVATWVRVGRIPLVRQVAILKNAERFGVDPVEAFKILAADLLEAAGVKI